jgi:hypothetical protein
MAMENTPMLVIHMVLAVENAHLLNREKLKKLRNSENFMKKLHYQITLMLEMFKGC